MPQFCCVCTDKRVPHPSHEECYFWLSHTPQAPYGSLAPYVHEEPLVGFPESMVLWATSMGPCVGIAPLTSPPRFAHTISPGWNNGPVPRSLYSNCGRNHQTNIRWARSIPLMPLFHMYMKHLSWGRPETRVFWARESGASMGIAPVINL